MSTMRQRISALYDASTPEVRALIDRYYFALCDPGLLKELEKLPRPLSESGILDVLIRATSRAERREGFTGSNRARRASSIIPV